MTSKIPGDRYLYDVEFQVIITVFGREKVVAGDGPFYWDGTLEGMRAIRKEIQEWVRGKHKGAEQVGRASIVNMIQCWAEPPAWKSAQQED